MGEAPYCPRCGERKDDHSHDERGRRVCADQDTDPDLVHAENDHVSVYRGERVGRRRGDY